MKVTQLTFLAFQLNGALGTGRYADVSIPTVKGEIRTGSIFEFLAGRIEFFDGSLLDNDDRAELIAEWRNLMNAVDEHRKFGVDENGLCLLVAYLLEGIQRRARDGGV